MPNPLTICLERMSAHTQERYVRCVALVGAGPGLGIDAQATIVWKQAADPACALRVSLDDRLLAVRAPGAPRIALHRAGRWVEAPESKPVVVLDGDELEISSVRFRVHVHGPAREIHSPTIVTAKRWLAATALASALVSTAGCKPDGGAISHDAASELVAQSDAATNDGPMDAPEQGSESADALDVGTDAGEGDGGVKRGVVGSSSTSSKTPPRPRVPKHKPIEVRDFPPFSE